MLKNKSTKLAVLSLLGMMSLTACGATTDEVYAKPDNYEAPIVEVDGKTDFQNNVLKIIYDAIHKGSLSSKVLDKSLYNFAESVFGAYNSLTTDTDEVTLKAAYLNLIANTEDKSVVNDFIKAHKAYWTRNDKGQHINDDDPEHEVVVENDETFTPCNSERELVRARWTAIENRIAEAMYTRALSGSTYTEKNLFREIKFVRSLHESGEKVNYAAAKDDVTLTPIFVPYTVEKQDVFGGTTTQPVEYMHREFYQSSAAINADTYTAEQKVATFVEDVIIPQIYNDLLIEQYLLEENVQAVRNSRARKINVLKIEKYSTFSNNADMLVKALVDEIYADAPAAGDQYVRTDAEEIETKGKVLFEKYGMIAKGVYDDIQADASAKAIVASLNAKASDVYEVGTYEGINYYKNTKYGDLIKEYAKVESATSWNDLDESLLAQYTNSGTTTIEEGLYQKTVDIRQQQNITKGWYINDKTPSLDSNGEINNRLFKLSVANAKIEVGDGDAAKVTANKEALTAQDRFEKTTGESPVWKLRDEWSKNENSYLCSINGTFYLKFDGQYAGADKRNDIVYDDGNAYYIVQVLEAAKDSKLRNATGSPDSSYAVTRGKAVLNEVIDEIAKVLGETGSYASVSKEHWLKKMDFKYHDQVVYDYFKDNYPDLF